MLKRSTFNTFAGGYVKKANLFLAAAVLLFSSTLVFVQGAAADAKTQPKTPDPCTSGHEFATTDCALSWHGITLYGTYDVGAGAGSATACRKTATTTKANLW